MCNSCRMQRVLDLLLRLPDEFVSGLESETVLIYTAQQKQFNLFSLSASAEVYKVPKSMCPYPRAL
jgi:hypothetical protein